MAFRNSKIAGMTDSGDLSKIQPSDLNFETLPSSPVAGDVYHTRTGTSPNRIKRTYLYDDGDWRLMSERVD